MRHTPNQQPPARKRLKAYVWRIGEKASLAHPCYTDLLTAVGLRIRVPRRRLGRGAFRAAHDRGRLQRIFAKRVGHELELQVRDGPVDVWRGRARFTGLEVPPDEHDDILVTVAFPGPLQHAELVRFGLADPEPPADVTPKAATPDAPVESVAACEAPVDEQPWAEDAASRRNAERVVVNVPVALHARSGRRDAEVQDLSRTGLRVHVALRDLGLEGTRGMQALAEGVGRVLAQRFDVDIHHERLGCLLRKRVRMTRLGTPVGAEDRVEICGQFDEPLEAEETMMLGIPLPPPGESAENWNAEVPVVAPRVRNPKVELQPRARPAAEREVSEPPREPVEETPTPEPVAPPPADDHRDASSIPGLTVARRLRAYVRAAEEGETRLAVGHTDLVGYEGVRVRIARIAEPPTAEEDANALAAIVARLGESFGAEPTLKLMAGADHLWTGRVRVAAVELPPEREQEMLVTFLYVRAPRPAEVRRLGLPALAA